MLPLRDEEQLHPPPKIDFLENLSAETLVFIGRDAAGAPVGDDP
jgi:hypothetical protein